MKRTAYSRRATALENAFFHQVNQQLIAEFEERRHLEVDESVLTIATGIADRDVIDELLDAEITPRTLVALSLFPAIYVGWAGGAIEPKERTAVLKAADGLGIAEGTPAWKLVSEWLKRRPSAELWKTWSDFIHALRPTMKVEAFNELRDAAMRRAEGIAACDGGFLGFHRESLAERNAIEELEAVWDDATTQKASIA